MNDETPYANDSMSPNKLNNETPQIKASNDLEFNKTVLGESINSTNNKIQMMTFVAEAPRHFGNLSADR